ncbi:MAG: response regulator [Symploca sp. SIO1B1]|nr:response regulator [Symploca sp. SIO1C2]NER46044.1 response regulator [Symploca sp. SIO1A3]NER93203.1 response regulator [Symploca sp. SIO1B1]
MKILLVDDDHLLARGTAKLIQRLGGHQVAITDEPEEIFQQCRSGEVDVVLMDVNLPSAQWEDKDVSGADIAYLIKSDPRTADIPVILITAYAMLSEQQHLVEVSQADDFFAKPITDYEALLGTITKLQEARQQKVNS